MKLYYTNYRKKEGVDSKFPIEVNEDNTVNVFLSLVDDVESFFGLIDDDNNCVQFVNEEKKWLLDVPKPPGFENLQAYLSDKDCLSLIMDIFRKKKIVITTKLYKVNIMHETLDDVLFREK